MLNKTLKLLWKKNDIKWIWIFIGIMYVSDIDRVNANKNLE